MLRHQVLFQRKGLLSCLFAYWLLLHFGLVGAQAPAVATSCTAPYVLQCGVCVLSSASQFGNVNGICNCNTQYGIVGPCNNQCNPPLNQLSPAAILCPNQAVAPYPNLPPVINSCPNQPVTPNPSIPPAAVHCPNQPVTPYPSIPPAAVPCPNQPVTPNPSIPPAAVPCPNQPVTPYPSIPPAAVPCPNQPVTPYPSIPPTAVPCPNQPVTPYPSIPPTAVHCPNQPVTPYPSIPPVAVPSPNQPVTPCPSVTITTPTPTTPTTPSTTTTLPPDPIIRCPRGTILIRGVCRQVYCSSGVYTSGQCLQASCPSGTIWTGIKCAPLAPIEVLNVHNKKTLISQETQKLPHLVVNNVNNFVVNASIALTQGEPEPDYYDVPPPPPPSPRKCCNVISPRICDLGVADRWQCYSHTQQQCGNFCNAAKMVLKAPSVQTWNNGNNLVMPPDWEAGNCRTDGTCTEATNYYDCSGCAIGHVPTCSSYCYQYRCSSHNCAYYDQQQYCAAYPGQLGCRSQDGWTQ